VRETPYYVVLSGKELLTSAMEQMTNIIIVTINISM